MIFPVLMAAALAATCHPVEGDSILGRDLAAADARFSALPTDAPLGFAPAPGARRIFHGGELARVAARYAMAADVFRDLCFERPLRPVDWEILLGALQASLGIAEARIEITELSLYPAPLGEIVFPRAGLGAVQAGTALWKGYVRYGTNRRFPLWVRVKIQVRTTHIVAAENLKAGAPVEASQVRFETSEGFPDSEPAAQSVEAVVGRVLRRGVRAGSVVSTSALGDPQDVSRGDRVKVEAVAGAARLELDGRAESGGKSGDTISVLNLKSGKKFPAQISGKGRVLVSQ